ncbi:hypothetical protein [Streptomyces virginiae]
MTRVFGRAALACRRGGDIEAVLAEVQQLLPGPRTQGAPLVDVVAAGATRKAVVKDLVKTWYQPLPEDVRHDWSNHAIAGDHGCATALEKLTGIKADTVRTEYLTEIRREIGDDPRRPDFDGLTHSPRGHDRSRICCRRGRSRRLSEAGGEQQREEQATVAPEAIDATRSPRPAALYGRAVPRGLQGLHRGHIGLGRPRVPGNVLRSLNRTTPTRPGERPRASKRAA